MSPSSADRPKVSIILELDNVRRSELARAVESIRRVLAQAAAHIEREAPERFVQLLVLYAEELLDPAIVAELKAEVEKGLSPQVRVTFGSTNGLLYYRLKNEGARRSEGDLIVFTDSDAVPEPGWFDALVAPFSDPSVGVACGTTYLISRTLYEKAFSLFWIFPPNPVEGPPRPAKWFFANNVCFRREVFLADPFTETDLRFRGQCMALAQRLLDRGVQMVQVPGAKASHPPPRGVVHFLIRAMADGHDDFMSALSRGPGHERFVSSLPRFINWYRNLTPKVMGRRKEAGFGVLPTVAALGIGASYVSASFVGSILARMSPAGFRRRFTV